jgi:hypothetical protein
VSNIADIRALVDDLNALLETPTAQKAPAIADKLGARPQFDRGVNQVKTIVDQITTVVRNIQYHAVGADALVALLGIVPPTVRGIGRIVEQSGKDLAQMGLGLDDLGTMGEQMKQPIEVVSCVLETGEAAAEEIVALAGPAELTRLVAALAAMSQKLLSLAVAPGR